MKLNYNLYLEVNCPSYNVAVCHKPPERVETANSSPTDDVSSVGSISKAYINTGILTVHVLHCTHIYVDSFPTCMYYSIGKYLFHYEVLFSVPVAGIATQLAYKYNT